MEYIYFNEEQANAFFQANSIKVEIQLSKYFREISRSFLWEIDGRVF